MQYQNTTTLEILSANQVKELFPNVAWDFNRVPPNAALINWGLSIYTPPPPTPLTEAQQLAISKPALIKSIDADVDNIMLAVVGNRATEYLRAETHANAFKDAGYTGVALSGVTSLATAKGWTNIQATDDILSQANAWHAAEDAIRVNRLKEKEAARVATDLAGITSAQNRWSGFVAYIRAQLGI